MSCNNSCRRMGNERRPVIAVGWVGVLLFATALGVASCASSPPTPDKSVSTIKYREGLKAFGAKNYDQAEALWLEAAQGTDEHAYEAMASLEGLIYAPKAGKKPNAEKYFNLNRKLAEHPPNREVHHGGTEFICIS